MEKELEQMSRDEGSHCSHYSLTGAPLPSLGATAARSNRRHKLRSFIVSPFNPRYRLTFNFVRSFLFRGFLNVPCSYI